VPSPRPASNCPAASAGVPRPSRFSVLIASIPNPSRPETHKMPGGEGRQKELPRTQDMYGKSRNPHPCRSRVQENAAALRKTTGGMAMASPAGRAAALTELLLPEGKAHLAEEEAQLKELFFRLLEAGR